MNDETTMEIMKVFSTVKSLAFEEVDLAPNRRFSDMTLAEVLTLTTRLLRTKNHVFTECRIGSMFPGKLGPTTTRVVGMKIKMPT